MNCRCPNCGGPIDLRKVRRSVVKPLVVEAYKAGHAVKNILTDFKITNIGNLYRILAEYGVPLRQPKRGEAIRAAMAEMIS
jgi:hypothetical protein